MKKISLIFLFAFGTNIIWENLHSYLYVGYEGGPITEFILLRASFWDAVIITAILWPFLYFNFLKNKPGIIFVIGILVALIIEWRALGTNRWSYNFLMPIIPFLGTGLTPTIQLGFLGYLTYKLQKYIATTSHV